MMSTKKSPANIVGAYFALALIVAFILVLPLFQIEPLLLLLLVAIFFVSLVMLLDIFHGLVLLLLTRPVLDIATDQTLMEVGPFEVNLAAMLGALTVSFGVLAWLKNRKKARMAPLTWQWLGFLAISACSVLFTISFPLSISELIRLASIFSVFMIGYLATESRRQLLTIAKIVVLSAIIPALFAIWQFFTKSGFSLSFEDVPNRLFGTFAHPNPFAYFLTFVLALLLFFMLKQKNHQRILAFLLFAFLAILLGLTFTRGAWLVLVGTLLLVGILKFRKLLLLGTLALMTLYFTVEPVHNRANSLLVQGPSSSIQWRIALWADSIDYITDRPVLGYGIGSAEEVILQKRGETFGSTIPHNDYLRLAIDLGIVGFLSFLTLVVSTIALFTKILKRQFASDSDRPILILIFFSYSLAIFGAMFVDNILDATALQWAFWATAGSLLALTPSLKHQVSK